MEIVECPGCFSDLRIPPRSEIGGLGAALQDMEEFVFPWLTEQQVCGQHMFRLQSAGQTDIGGLRHGAVNPS